MMVISRKIKEDDGILKRFTRLGKAELYLDLLFFIRFGSARYYLYALLDAYSSSVQFLLIFN
jgi:hypothetical protein